MKRPVKIYALINPVDNSIFYIGATRTKLVERLKLHCCFNNAIPKTGIYRDRTNLISEIKLRGLLPDIFLLHECEFEDRSHSRDEEK